MSKEETILVKEYQKHLDNAKKEKALAKVVVFNGESLRGLK